MNIRKFIYLSLWDLRGEKLTSKLSSMYDLEKNGNFDQSKSIIDLLNHCKKNVPYYQKIIQNFGNNYHDNPYEYIKNFPILNKEIIKKDFHALSSLDLNSRKWFYMTSGGSTGEPAKVIQDREFAAKSGAINLFFSKLLGREIGDLEIYFWGSERDIIQGKQKWQVKLLNKLNNSIYINAFRMSPETMFSSIKLLNEMKPILIISYVEAINALAKFAEKEQIYVEPQKAIITSAGTLYPFMRHKIENIFNCKVYNRYGSRELGLIACERPGINGLFVPPQGNFIEIVNEKGNPVEYGSEGEILVTSLTNYAMPLIRYKIGDIGILSKPESNDGEYKGQILEKVIGRSTGLFRTTNGAIIDPGYFVGLLYYKDWIEKYQIIQKNYDHILFRIVNSDSDYPHPQVDLEEIIDKSKLIMGVDCRVEFEFVKEIPTSASGKFNFVLSEILE